MVAELRVRISGLMILSGREFGSIYERDSQQQPPEKEPRDCPEHVEYDVIGSRDATQAGVLQRLDPQRQAQACKQDPAAPMRTPSNYGSECERDVCDDVGDYRIEAGVSGNAERSSVQERRPAIPPRSTCATMASCHER
jgi:hypothetical protein